LFTVTEYVTVTDSPTARAPAQFRVLPVTVAPFVASLL
jgi:hypothetical protein